MGSNPCSDHIWMGLCIILLSLSCCSISYEVDKDGFIPLYAMTPNEMFDDPSARSLAWAAGRGNIRRINRLILEDGMDVDQIGHLGATPIFWALQRENKRGFDRLLELGADPNHLWDTGDSVMSHVSQMSDSHYLEQVLKHGGDVNLTNPRTGTTPIFDAVKEERSNLDNIILLTTNGANVNLYDGGGITPLIWSVVFDRYDIAFLLLQAGADPRMKVINNAYEPDVGVLINIRRGREAGDSEMTEWRRKVVALIKEKGYDIEDSGFEMPLREI